MSFPSSPKASMPVHPPPSSRAGWGPASPAATPRLTGVFYRVVQSGGRENLLDYGALRGASSRVVEADAHSAIDPDLGQRD
ncbi:hypothetical protein CFAM422_001470 [Trichoderma lentiforme]|uniref:Uncharacterized protein n=1 Tax=Trichoderma lentiforme TaxID=1567552 RepID=A0A9P4XQD4_9HYPO|nr:hypothetical protein CFAM422_001470 [Trichoderma lentiforme]